MALEAPAPEQGRRVSAMAVPWATENAQSQASCHKDFNSPKQEKSTRTALIQRLVALANRILVSSLYTSIPSEQLLKDRTSKSFLVMREPYHPEDTDWTKESSNAVWHASLMAGYNQN